MVLNKIIEIDNGILDNKIIENLSEHNSTKIIHWKDKKLGR